MLAKHTKMNDLEYMNIECESECLDLNSAFSFLRNEERQELMQSHKRVSFKPGQVVVKQGTAVTHYPIFVKGIAKAYYERIGGGDLLMSIVGKGFACGCSNLLPGFEHQLTYQALEPMEVCFISSQAIESIFKNNPEFAAAIYNSKQQSIINITNKLARLTYKTVESRVADVILYLSKDVYKNNAFTFTLNRQDLADLAAISKESFIRTIKVFRDNSIIKMKGKHITILSMNELISISQSK